MNASHSPRKSTFLALLQPLGAAIGAVFAFGVLIMATRQGQFTSIASFGAGAGGAALASVAAGGGTTFAYTTGTVARQRAVRMVRSSIVLPAIALGTAAAVVLYAVLGKLDPLGVVAGGLSVVASVGSELDASYLRRHLMTGQLFVADTLYRVIAFALMPLGVPFAFAMLTGSVCRSLLLRVFARSDPSRKGAFRISRPALALAYEAKMTSISVLYSICDRVGALTAPGTTVIPIAGGFMAVLSAQQSASGVLLTGLQTTLAARSQQRSRLRWANRLDVLFVVVGFGIAAVMMLWQQRLVGILGLQSSSAPQEYWPAVALLVPASLASRLFEFRFLASDAVSIAVASRAAATIVAVCAAVAAFGSSRIAILADGLVTAEIVSVLASVGCLTVRYFRPTRGRDHG